MTLSIGYYNIISVLAYIYIALASDHKYSVTGVYTFYNVWFYPTSIYSITVSDNSTMKVKWKIQECANFMPYLHVLELTSTIKLWQFLYN